MLFLMKEFLSNYINALTYEDIFDNLCMSFKYSIINLIWRYIYI